MATNTIVLIVVAAMGALVLVGMLAVVVVKTRARARDGKGATLANAAVIEIESSLQHQARSYRSEAVTSRDQLNEQRVHRLAG